MHSAGQNINLFYLLEYIYTQLDVFLHVYVRICVIYAHKFISECSFGAFFKSLNASNT